MTIDAIIAQIDSEISRLQKARAFLAGNATPAAKRGPKPGKSAKRTMSAEGRKRIAEAQRKRWAAAKKATAKKATAKKATPKGSSSVPF